MEENHDINAFPDLFPDGNPLAVLLQLSGTIVTLSLHKSSCVCYEKDLAKKRIVDFGPWAFGEGGGGV